MSIKITRRLTHKVRTLLGCSPTPTVERETLEVSSLKHLFEALGWREPPELTYPHLDEFECWEDINSRKRNDAQVVAAACYQPRCRAALEIGTADGKMTAIMAEAAPHAQIFTVNISAEEISTGGRLITYAPNREEIGSFYRKRNCHNVTQFFANTIDWTPIIPKLDVVFIDGCHDAEFVYSDTVLAIAHCRSQSVLLWHDFAPKLQNRYEWIRDVCLGVEWLLRDKKIKGPILHLKDSWIGLCRLT